MSVDPAHSPLSRMSLRRTSASPTRTVPETRALPVALPSSPVRSRTGASILSVSTGDSGSPTEKDAPYGEWSHRFISPLLPMVSSLLPHLQELSLCGCHINDNDFITMLRHLTLLVRLDISYSTLKTEGVNSVSRYARHKLEWLNISGIFKLGRNRQHAIVNISAHCTALKTIVALDCPEIYEETLDDCKLACGGRIEFSVTMKKE
ncbi:hypothetical protein HDU91_003715 [Kappamyces sp. JEL0680]|nr:hypothetical protein HDU91_003715 [Kappamyces sp. JEL0680]